MSERLKYQGRLAEKRQEARRVRLRMEGLVTSLRDLLDPTEDVEALAGEMIADQALQLAGLCREIAALSEEIAKIEKLLGV